MSTTISVDSSIPGSPDWAVDEEPVGAVVRRIHEPTVWPTSCDTPLPDTWAPVVQVEYA